MFAGIELPIAASGSCADSDSRNPGRKETTTAEAGTGYHGRQEYVLRWVVKKWSADGEKGREARCCREAWTLFSRCVESVPVRSAARIMQERKFGALLRKTVEEGAETATRTQQDNNTGSVGEVSKTQSKKRRRDGSPVSTVSAISQENADLRLEVSEAIAAVVKLSKPSDGGADGFQAEYMRSVIRLSTDDAAKILQSWLNWNLTLGQSNHGIVPGWLSSFIEIWSLHVVVAGNEDVKTFSKHCLEPLLHLLTLDDAKSPWKPQLEQLLARNIIIPARASYEAENETDHENASNATLLKRLAGDVLSRSPRFAPVLFKLAVRCLPPHGIRRRRPGEMAWLQAVFNTCKVSIWDSSESVIRLSNTNIALGNLLKSAMDCSVVLDLPLLRSIVSESAFTSKETDWSMVATVIKLDSNVFLISESMDDLLQDLLKRITSATIEDGKRLSQDQLCCDIVVPLMGEFAKARNLSSFVHHWYEQLRVFEEHRLKSKPIQSGIPDPCVWEDDRLQVKMIELMESTLTVQQVGELMEWLEEKISECSSAVYVVADAVAAATMQDETIEAIGGRLNKLPLNRDIYLESDMRYRVRFWNIARRSYEWAFKDYAIEYDDVRKLNLLERQIILAANSSEIFTIVFTAMFKCFCADRTFKAFSDPHELDIWASGERQLFALFLEQLTVDSRDTASHSKDDNKTINSIPYQCHAFVQTVCVEYPEVLG